MSVHTGLSKGNEREVGEEVEWKDWGKGQREGVGGVDESGIARRTTCCFGAARPWSLWCTTMQAHGPKLNNAADRQKLVCRYV